MERDGGAERHGSRSRVSRLEGDADHDGALVRCPEATVCVCWSEGAHVLTCVLSSRGEATLALKDAWKACLLGDLVRLELLRGTM